MMSRPSIEWTTESRVEIRITIKSKIKIETNLLLGAAIILLATLAVYWPAVHAGFIWDDDDILTSDSEPCERTGNLGHVDSLLHEGVCRSISSEIGRASC